MENILFVLITFLVSGVISQEFVVDPLNTTSVVGAWPSIHCYIDQEIGDGQALEFLKIGDSTSQLLGTHEGPEDANEHNVTGQYSLIIKDVRIEDEGRYQCSLEAGGTEVRDTYLHVSDPPSLDGLELYWDGGRSWTEVDTRSELTCATDRSRPPATFRFIRDGEDISHLAKYTASNIDSNGYGSASATIVMRLSWDDEDSHIRCLADVPGGEGIVWDEVYITLGVPPMSANLAIILPGLLMTSLANIF